MGRTLTGRYSQVNMPNGLYPFPCSSFANLVSMPPRLGEFHCNTFTSQQLEPVVNFLAEAILKPEYPHAEADVLPIGLHNELDSEAS